MVQIRSWDEVPEFQGEAEEAKSWEIHQVGEAILDTFQRTALSAEETSYHRSRSRPVAVRFDESTLRRLRAFADRRHEGYQMLLKEFVVEQLHEEEKRESLVG